MKVFPKKSLLMANSPLAMELRSTDKNSSIMEGKSPSLFVVALESQNILIISFF